MFTKSIAVLALAGFLTACSGLPTTDPVSDCIKDPYAPECSAGKDKAKK